MLRMLMSLVVTSYALAWPAVADPYWIAYEGNDFPENEGWGRIHSDPNGVVGQGGAIRTLEDGVLVLDSRESVMIVDFYEIWRPIDPDAGEVFVMQWGLSVPEVASSYPYDLSVSVFSDESFAVGFEIGESSLRSGFENLATVYFDPGVAHDFELTSTDMREYELRIDREVVRYGDFASVITASRVGWGDGIQGATSLSRWDYFRFGVVPEPNSLIQFGLLLSLGTFFTRRAQQGDPP